MVRTTPAAMALALFVWPIAAQEAETGAITVARSATAEPAAAVPAGIDLKPTAETTGSSILLRDVAELPEDSLLAGVDLGPSPLPGHSRTITADQIELRLERAGFGDEAGTLTGAGSVVVTRQSNVPSPTDIQAAVKAILPFDILIERLPPRHALPVGQVSYRLGSALPNPLPERFMLTLDILVDQRVADQLSLSVRRVAAPPAPAGELQVVAVTDVPETYVSGLAARPAALGPAVTPGLPAAPAWEVKRGDKLSVEAVSGNVRITLMAEARETGTLGDIIQCETRINNERRLLAARLIAPDKAILEF